jgi:hypothetical protein
MAAPSRDQLFGDTTDYVVFGGVVVATVLLAPSWETVILVGARRWRRR